MLKPPERLLPLREGLALYEEPLLREDERELFVVVPREGLVVVLREEPVRELPREVEGTLLPRKVLREEPVAPERLPPREVTSRGATYEPARRPVLLKVPRETPPRRDPPASAPPPTWPNELPRRPP